MILQTPFQVTINWAKGKQITQAEFLVFIVDTKERGRFSLSLVVESILKLRHVGTMCSQDFHQAKKGNDSICGKMGRDYKGQESQQPLGEIQMSLSSYSICLFLPPQPITIPFLV